MKKVAIVYASSHHHNTKKLVENIALKCKIDLFDVLYDNNIDLSNYDIVGFASGIYMSTFHKSLFKFINVHNLPNKAFLIYTCGSGSKKYSENIKSILVMKGINVLGIYSCRGFDTYGIWKFIGGIAKGHPTPNDILKGIDFVNKIINN